MGYQEKYPDPAVLWIGGVFALWVGFLAMCLVFFSYALLLLVPYFMGVGFAVASGVDPDAAFTVGMLIISPFSLVFLVWFASRFFSLYLRLVGRVGWFLQRAQYVSLGDTLGDVKHYEALLRSDVKRLMRWLRGKN